MQNIETLSTQQQLKTYRQLKLLPLFQLFFKSGNDINTAICEFIKQQLGGNVYTLNKPLNVIL